MSQMTAVDVVYNVEGNGPPLYMVHGIGHRKEGWQRMVECLKNDFTCVSYDLRGHGMSPIPATPYTLEQLIDDLEGVRRRLGHEKIHIVGHSLGGMIGPGYARAYPERTLSVALLSTAAGRSDEDRAKLAGVLKALKTDGIAETLGTLIDRWFTDDFCANRPEVVKQRLQQVIDTPADVFLSVFDIYASTEMGPWLQEIDAPCLVLTGEFDGGCNPRLNQFIDSQLKHSELVILKGYKHDILNEASELVAQHLAKFLHNLI
jgi:3-oxoadipate enol-lactonase